MLTEALGEWSILWKSKKAPSFTSETPWATDSTYKDASDHDIEEALWVASWVPKRFGTQPKCRQRRHWGHSLCSKQVVWLQRGVCQCTSAGPREPGKRKSTTFCPLFPFGTQIWRPRCSKWHRADGSWRGNRYQWKQGEECPVLGCL